MANSSVLRPVDASVFPPDSGPLLHRIEERMRSPRNPFGTALAVASDGSTASRLRELPGLT